MTKIIAPTRWLVSSDTKKWIMEYQDRCSKDTLQFFILLYPCVVNKKIIQKQLNLFRLSLDIINFWSNTTVYLLYCWTILQNRSQTFMNIWDYLESILNFPALNAVPENSGNVQFPSVLPTTHAYDIDQYQSCNMYSLSV